MASTYGSALNTAAAVRSSPADWLGKHWFALFALVYGAWVLGPFLAPVFMEAGWQAPGRAVYALYSLFCHQLPERSFFLFGEQPMYALSVVQAAFQDTANPMILRRFVGTEQMGWKFGWSDRMFSFYTSVWLFSLAWWPLRRRLRPLAWWGCALLLLPMIVDGGTHAISDLAGIGSGFRDSNSWLTAVFGAGLPAGFVAGDGLGSFNSWMRLITGPLAGLGLVWFALPHTQPAGNGTGA